MVCPFHLSSSFSFSLSGISKLRQSKVVPHSLFLLDGLYYKNINVFKKFLKTIWFVLPLFLLSCPLAALLSLSLSLSLSLLLLSAICSLSL